jgi:uncharacterized protein YbbC (DUF1343 family)
MITVGIEQLAASPHPRLRERRLALLCNHASTDRFFRHSRDIINEVFPGCLTCLFSPQHGFFSEKQDNMVESAHGRDPATGLPVFSLYAEKRKPDPEMFDLFDVLLVDLVDVGTRVYTYAWTVVYCLQTAAETGRKVIVLDRPNPLGGLLLEGNLLLREWRSFVGLCEIPMRHGMTLGELALLCNDRLDIHADLEVVPAAGWRRGMLQRECGFPWVYPSPNMPTPDTALVYPGQVIWEGTNISEGRGTALPFELFGAPYVEPGKILDYLAGTSLPGCVLRPVTFEPTSGKWAGRNCGGFQLHITDPHAFRPYRTSLALLGAMLQLYPRDFAYKEPPYEYEFTRLPMDLILGDQDVRLALEAGAGVDDLERLWQDDLASFAQQRQGVLLYEDR